MDSTKKPLPPIPRLRERKSHVFSSVPSLGLSLNLKRRSELAPTPTPTPQVDSALAAAVPPQRTSSTLPLASALAAAAAAGHGPGTGPGLIVHEQTPGQTAGQTAGQTTAALSSSAMAKHYITLDQPSTLHLRAIARQSIASSCLEPEILWLKLFMDVIQALSTNMANAWLQIETSDESTHERLQEQDARLAAEAAVMATALATAGGEGEADNKGEKKADQKRNRKGGKKTDQNPHPRQRYDSLHVESEDKSQQPIFTYDLRLEKRIGSKQVCTFTPGRFEGEHALMEEQSITERKRSVDEDRIRIQLGGTVSLVAGPEDLPKAEKILELLLFALCSLQLEMHLFRDHGVVRSEPALVIPATASQPETEIKPTVPLPGTLSNSKRASKGSMFFGWFSRGNLPAKYKKGTTQLAQEDGKVGHFRQHNNASGKSTAAPPIGEDFGMGEDLHTLQSYRFAKITQQIEKAIISVSPDIHFPPPHLLLRLRDEEAVGPDSKRKSYTWEDIEFVAKKIGFGNRIHRYNTAHINGQPLRIGPSPSTQSTASRATRLPIDSRAGMDHLMTNSNSLQGIFNHQSISFSYSYYWSATAATPCNAPNLITVEYYRKEGQYEDMGLGEMIEYVCKRANAICQERTCGRKRLEHISTYTHGEARINLTVEQPLSDSTTDFESEEFRPFLDNKRTIAVWTRCKMCKARTAPQLLSRASKLYSFGKYLELLLYSQNFIPGSRPLCEHAVVRDALVRCFMYRKLVVVFEVESIDLFEMRISRLQVNEDFPTMPRYHLSEFGGEDVHEFSTASTSSANLSPKASMVSMSLSNDYFTDANQSSLINTTRLEILNFYDSCKRIIVDMEKLLGERKSVDKQLKGLASSSTTRSANLDPAKKAALDRLDELGARWKEEEFDLYGQLKRVPVSRLNDLRNRLRDCIKRTMRSMESWQKENLSESDLKKEETKDEKEKEDVSVAWVLPDYVESDSMHTFPGSSVIVREDEPSSIIASALSSMDYLSLLSMMCDHGSDEDPADVAPIPPKKDISLSTTASTARGSQQTPLRTSDSAGDTTLGTRKSGSSGGSSSTTATSSNAVDRSPGGKGSPRRHAVGESGNDQDDDGEDFDDDSFLVVDGYQTSVKFVQVAKVDFTSLIPNGTTTPRSTIGLHFGSSSRQSRNHAAPPSVIERKTADGGGILQPRPESMMATSTPTLVASPASTPGGEFGPSASIFLSPHDQQQYNSRSTTPTPTSTLGPKSSRNSFGYHAFTSGLSGTMKGLSLNALSEKIGSGFTSYGTTSSTHLDKAGGDYFKGGGGGGGAGGERLGMPESYPFDRETDGSTRSPHLKARFSHGKTSFSCTVYYAAEFDTLRRRCGIHQDYVQSLSRCNSWNASGGKSKSSFYKTKDDRFVVKQMVSSWNVAEKDELLKFAPKYFEYMERTQDAPTVLAKIFGFYTFKIKNGAASGQALKIDVLVMEHLFFNQKITRTFDLKGIQDRHAGSKPNTTGGGSTTLWDGDFIEGRYKALLLIHSHSKKIIRQSLLSDTEFLAGANIMDYSLLVGVDDERKELVVGIVDFIGAYTWQKRIESKGKTTLRGAKDNVTVLPPQQYKTRFREAMEKYFLAVPDKWSKTVVEQQQEAQKEMAAIIVPSTIMEGSREGMATPTPTTTTLAVPSPVEQTLKNKTSGYLEKMSKAILPAKVSPALATDVGVAAVNSVASALVTVPDATTGKNGSMTVAAAGAEGVEGEDKEVTPRPRKQTATATAGVVAEQEMGGRKLPRVFYPLD